LAKVLEQPFPAVMKWRPLPSPEEAGPMTSMLTRRGPRPLATAALAACLSLALAACSGGGGNDDPAAETAAQTGAAPEGETQSSGDSTDAGEPEAPSEPDLPDLSALSVTDKQFGTLVYDSSGWWTLAYIENSGTTPIAASVLFEFVDDAGTPIDSGQTLAAETVFPPGSTPVSATFYAFGDFAGRELADFNVTITQASLTPVFEAILASGGELTARDVRFEEGVDISLTDDKGGNWTSRGGWTVVGTLTSTYDFGIPIRLSGKAIYRDAAGNILDVAFGSLQDPAARDVLRQANLQAQIDGDTNLQTVDESLRTAADTLVPGPDGAAPFVFTGRWDGEDPTVVASVEFFPYASYDSALP
jgi:hypothetical protein